MKIKKHKDFLNGSVYCIELEDGKLIETTDTYLPFYTKNAIGKKQNLLHDYNICDRSYRWMIGVSVMSGCPIRCKFCATGQMKEWRNLTSDEIVNQIEFVINKNSEYNPKDSKEFKINYTRMGEPFLNIENVKQAIDIINIKYPNTHHYISTIGIKKSDFSWIKDNITLQLSVHSFDDKYRDWLIPTNNKLSLLELGQIRTNSFLKTTLNLTLVKEQDFDIKQLKRYFNKDNFFIKLSPININDISEKNKLGEGFIKSVNLL